MNVFISYSTYDLERTLSDNRQVHVRSTWHLILGADRRALVLPFSSLLLNSQGW
jgi:hypothetical protein